MSKRAVDILFSAAGQSLVALAVSRYANPNASHGASIVPGVSK